MSNETNVAFLLTQMAEQNPEQMAIAVCKGQPGSGRDNYQCVSFRELDQDSSRIAGGLLQMGVPRGSRIVLMVRPGIEFISLVFALFKAGMVTVLIDPGMGRENLVRCLAEVEPDGFVAIPLAQAIRTVMRRRFPKAKWNVTVGRRWFWRGPTLEQVRKRGESVELQAVELDDPAAIIFTTGSTGPPKGVLYRHGNFLNQAKLIRDQYGVEAGEIDLPGFPLFGLFNCAMGVSTVIPKMDPTRPADVDPETILAHMQDWGVTQAFGSPAMWNAIGRYCDATGRTSSTLRRVMSAGAPVPPRVLQWMMRIMQDQGEMHTPYGATEALPVATISATEVLGETRSRYDEGAGTCVGKRFGRMDWRVVEISDDPIDDISKTKEVPRGAIGELMVKGPVVTTEYVTRKDANADHKVADGDGFWHRMGDVGYLDDQDRFWFCGRKAHRVRTEEQTLYTIPCEAIINQDERVYRSALVGVGEPGRQTPVFVVECWPEHRPPDAAASKLLIEELTERIGRDDLTSSVKHVLLKDALPVDIRHNSKIFRERIAEWAAGELRD